MAYKNIWYLLLTKHLNIKTNLICYFVNNLQLEQLESELAGDRDSLRSAESLSTDLMKEKALLEKTLETLRENSERQVHIQMYKGLSLNQMVLILNDHY